MTNPKIVLTEFSLSHFDGTKHDPAIPRISPEQFELEINKRTPELIGDGYAPFCKLMWFENWTYAQAGIVPFDISVLDNDIVTEYEARRDSELPVLVRYKRGSRYSLPLARYLCVVVYDKEQMAKEGTPIDADFAVVNILRTMTIEEPPLPPITMMRNALGVEHGGSGVPLDRDKYMASVEFWSKHVSVKPG